jgi:hypothetical protein
LAGDSTISMIMQGLMEQRVVVSGEVVELAEAAYAGVVRSWVGGFKPVEGFMVRINLSDFWLSDFW